MATSSSLTNGTSRPCNAESTPSPVSALSAALPQERRSIESAVAEAPVLPVGMSVAGYGIAQGSPAAVTSPLLPPGDGRGGTGLRGRRDNSQPKVLSSCIMSDREAAQEAMRHQQIEFVEQLLTIGVDPDKLLADWSPIAAPVAGKFANALIAAILKHDPLAAQRQFGRSQYTLLHVAVFCGASLECCEDLYGRGAVIDAKDTTGGTPLYYATFGSQPDVAVPWLLDRGASLIEPDEESRLLHSLVMARQPRLTALRALIGAGLDVNARDAIGCTPLHVLARFGNEANAQILLEAGVDVHAQDNNGMTPLDIARNRKNGGALVALLEEHSGS